MLKRSRVRFDSFLSTSTTFTGQEIFLGALSRLKSEYDTSRLYFKMGTILLQRTNDDDRYVVRCGVNVKRSFGGFVQDDMILDFTQHWRQQAARPISVIACLAH